MFLLLFFISIKLTFYPTQFINNLEYIKLIIKKKLYIQLKTYEKKKNY